jgi:uncharacterized membrane protein YphA (DoxX/SURF4 family)
MKKEILISIIAALLILLFVYSGVTKLIEVKVLKSILGNYPLLQKFPHFVAWGLPIVEIIVSILLFLPVTRIWGLYAALGLLIGFTLYIGWILCFGSKLPCTCGGMLKEMTWNQHIVFNCFFIALSIIGIQLTRTQKRRIVENKQKLMLL